LDEQAWQVLFVGLKIVAPRQDRQRELVLLKTKLVGHVRQLAELEDKLK
jgi:hypothetical protein